MSAGGRRHDVAAVEDADLVDGDECLHAVADEPVRDAVPHRVDVDERVVGDAPPQAAAVGRERPCGQ
jgi:hypothetical protein